MWPEQLEVWNFLGGMVVVYKEIMNIFAGHRKFAGGLAAVLFLLSNSGFTAVVHYCAMKVSPSATCCSSMAHGNENEKGKRAPISESTIGAPPVDCHLTAFVGGLSDRLALVEKMNSLDSPKTEACFLTPQCPRFVYGLESHSSYAGALLAVSTSPSVEKCILNSSFLI